tara:strand:- start:1637 stop:1960 length:324 start_codon:yes stop_codon:yes gene_type:complete
MSTWFTKRGLRDECYDNTRPGYAYGSKEVMDKETNETFNVFTSTYLLNQDAYTTEQVEELDRCLKVVRMNNERGMPPARWRLMRIMNICENPGTYMPNRDNEQLELV